MYVHWDQAYETGQPLMDAEHRLLVLLFRRLDVGIKTHESDATLKHMILEVRKYVDFHFVSEENLMRETDYPGIEAHMAFHTELLLELNARAARLTTHREYPDDLLEFLSRWLVEHIANQDQDVARHVRDAVNRPVAENAYGDYLLSLAPDAVEY